MTTYLATLPAFLQWWGLGAALTVLFASVYLLVTPQREIRLIRDGNVSASVSFCGALFGYVLPMASAIAHGVNVLDLIVWGLVAMAVQLLVYGLLRLWLRDLTASIEAGKLSVAILAASVSLAAGLLNAAAMTY